MSITPLCNEDDISRYINPGRVPDGVPSVGAFVLKQEDYFSVHWLQFFGCLPEEDAIAEIRNDVKLKLSENGRFAVFTIGDIREVVKDRYNPLRVEHFIPSPCQKKDRSHSGVYFDKDDDQVSSDLAQLARSEKVRLYPGKLPEIQEEDSAEGSMNIAEGKSIQN